MINLFPGFPCFLICGYVLPVKDWRCYVAYAYFIALIFAFKLRILTPHGFYQNTGSPYGDPVFYAFNFL
jgi:hypothetical protein